MSTNVSQIIEQLKTLTLMESTELVAQIEEVFGVDASAPVGGGMMMAAPGAAAGEAAAEEKTTFDVNVESIASDKRVAVLKVIRKLTSLGLADAKEFTTSLPKALKEGVSKEEAEEAKTELEAAGAKVTIS
uniref:Large ribosomal subunit protein bL12c n=1 Tax=Halochlorococcum sp. NIES-1838 TaxID=2249730 RepID=A0A2Z4M9Y3_9CHLO|nr:ribosomal protein L12 [Halochlorococcum sp. NIES-1838]